MPPRDIERTVLMILQNELRLVPDGGKACGICGTPLDVTWKVEDGNLEQLAALIAQSVR